MTIVGTAKKRILPNQERFATSDSRKYLYPRYDCPELTIGSFEGVRDLTR